MHVLEARTWISNWQRSQLEQAVNTVKESPAPASAPEPKKAPVSPFAPSSVSLDGTLTFTSDSLTSISYKQALEANK